MPSLTSWFQGIHPCHDIQIGSKKWKKPDKYVNNMLGVEGTIECFNINGNCIPYKSKHNFFKWFKWTWLLLFLIYYYNLWIIHVQSLANLPKSIWKLVFNVTDVNFSLEVLKIKPTKSRWIMTHVKLSKTYVFGI